MRTTLCLDDPRVESFPVEPVAVPERAQAPRTPYGSAIDLCPTRPCRA